MLVGAVNNSILSLLGQSLLLSSPSLTAAPLQPLGLPPVKQVWPFPCQGLYLLPFPLLHLPVALPQEKWFCPPHLLLSLARDSFVRLAFPCVVGNHLLPLHLCTLSYALPKAVEKAASALLGPICPCCAITSFFDHSEILLACPLWQQEKQPSPCLRNKGAFLWLSDHCHSKWFQNEESYCL